MKLTKILGWILIGVVVGVLADHAASLHAQYLGLSQQRVFQVGDARGVFAEPREVANRDRYSFVKDSKSGGCWLKYEQNIGVGVAPAVSLAAAPAEACQ